MARKDGGLVDDGLAVRVNRLEEQFEKVDKGLQRVELEQQHAREVLDARFNALNKGQDLLIEKFETLAKTVVDGSDPTQKNTDKRVQALEAVVDGIKSSADELRGALAFAKQSGIASLLIALAAIALALAHIWFPAV